MIEMNKNSHIVLIDNTKFIWINVIALDSLLSRPTVVY